MNKRIKKELDQIQVEFEKLNQGLAKALQSARARKKKLLIWKIKKKKARS